MDLLKHNNLLTTLGGFISLIALLTPAALFIGDRSVGYVTVFYFFFNIYIEQLEWEYISWTNYAFELDIIGLICSLLLLIGGLIGVIIGRDVIKKSLPPKIRGGALILPGILIVVFLIIWVDSHRVFIHTAFRGSLAGSFKINLFLGPGVYLGFIGAGLLITSGFLSLINVIKDKKRRYCVKCGRNIPWDANFCQYCGHDYTQ